MEETSSPPVEERAAQDPSDLIGLVRSAWRDALGYDTFDDDTSFFDAGGDSFVLVSLIERISKSSGLTMKAVDVLRSPTIRSQAALLIRQRDGGES
ncbi:acyl carrier protein [Actinacidiphila yeochonensis]|uniref:acyl carrier protein n=1 Tax=Actinacidiphila yeochonensis TaxID=89050 RepID=UPI00056BB4B9|nr:acyl carrier protein [Actinacidiphila yeochonensis]